MKVKRQSIERWVKNKLLSAPVAATLTHYELERWKQQYAYLVRGGLAALTLLFFVGGTVLLGLGLPPYVMRVAVVPLEASIVGVIILLMLGQRIRTLESMQRLGVAALAGFIGWLAIAYLTPGKLSVELTQIAAAVLALKLVVDNYMGLVSVLAVIYYFASESLGLGWAACFLAPLALAPLTWNLWERIARMLWAMLAALDRGILGRWINQFYMKVLELCRNLRFVIQQLGVARTVVLVLCLGVLAYSFLVGRIPGWESAWSQVDGYKAGFTGLGILYLTMLPRERPVFSVLMCVLALALVLPQVVRLGHGSGLDGFLLTLEGTRFHIAKLGIAVVALLLYRRFGRYVTKSKRPLRDLVQLGPMGTVAVALLLALS